jgi:hypothetical protein
MATVRTDGPTPAGGAYGIAFLSDDAGRDVARDEATRVVITEYDADGELLRETWGTVGSASSGTDIPRSRLVTVVDLTSTDRPLHASRVRSISRPRTFVSTVTRSIAPSLRQSPFPQVELILRDF